MAGQIVIWEKDVASNVVYAGDIAVSLEGERFLGLRGSVKDKIFYESNKHYRKLTHNEEMELFVK